jgi:UDP-N-acetylglucosamine--N-acetylmuramyl-(pentapeptide) pyrophosphoryl-undecaprenol N-acetylglucosamine transferase
MRILIFMCGEGLGHTSRCIALGSELMSGGHDVSFGAYGYSKGLIEKTGYTAHEIPSEIKLMGKSGSLSMRESIGATIKNAQILGGPKVLKLLDNLKPDVVVSDSYYLGILAAKAKGLHVNLIVNQTNMQEFFQNRGVPMKVLGELARGFYTKVFEHVERIIIPDYPAPYTICRRSLSFSEEMVGKLFFSGPLVRKKSHKVKAKKTRQPHVLSMVGGFGYRENLFKNILEASKVDKDIGYTLVAGPNVQMNKYGKIPKNVKVLPFIEDPFPYIKGSDVIIAPGGHSTIMEALSFGKPVLSVPDMLHSEQENNATVLGEEGVGKRLSYQTPPAVLLECIHEVLEDRAFHRKTQRLMRLSEELDGPKGIRKLLESSG